MKVVQRTLPKSLQEIELHVFADWHLGDAHCNKSLIEAQIDSVLKKNNAYVICNGDLCNMATKASVSDVYSERMSPGDQQREVVRLLEPIKNRILMFTQGNHERRIYKADGFDVCRTICHELDIDDAYVAEGGVLFLSFGCQQRRRSEGIPQLYAIYASHGSGNGSKAGGKINRLAEMASIVDADIYIHAHTHLPAVMKDGFYRLNMNGHSVTYLEKLYVNSDSTLEYGGYSQEMGLKPAAIGCPPVILLSGKKRDMTAKI